MGQGLDGCGVEQLAVDAREPNEANLPVVRKSFDKALDREIRHHSNDVFIHGTERDRLLAGRDGSNSLIDRILVVEDRGWRASLDIGRLPDVILVSILQFPQSLQR